MAPDERDRRFEKALGRHLRSSGSSKEAENARTGSALQRHSCPDAETLAVYHERSLLPDEMNFWKAHIVGCPHCQAILAELERTDQIPLQAGDEEVRAGRESQFELAGRRHEELPATAPGQRQPAADAATPVRTRAPRLIRGPRWRWLAPAGAIAASLLVWIALHENQPPRLPSTNETKLAKNEPPPPPPSGYSQAPAATPPAQQPAPSQQLHATLAKPHSAADEISSSNARAVRGDVLPKVGYASKPVPKMPPADKEGGTEKDLELKAAEELRREANQANLDTKAVAGALQEKVQVQAQAPQAPSVSSQNQNQFSYNAPKRTGPGPLDQADATKKLKSIPAAPAPAAATEAASRVQGLASMQMVAVSNPRLVAAPNSSVLWRTGRAGFIEFSEDGGKSWTRQSSGVMADLLTGSAPSDKVCWIVGRAGTILITADGGAHWKLVRSPLHEDLGGVRATDALHATIWNVRNTKSFETSDGGLTWKPVGNE